MTAPQSRRVRLLDSLYRTYGEPARWAPVDRGAVTDLTIRRHEDQDQVRFGEGRARVDRVILCVRRAELAGPVEGDLVTALDRDTGAELDTYRIIAEPALKHSGLEWWCEAALFSRPA